MSNLIIGTHYVNMDEPCYFLIEQNERRPDSKGFNRYQSLTVIRGDQKVVLRRDLGPALAFKADTFQIPGGATDPATGRLYVEHTVGELLDIADHLREGPYEPPERPETHDLARAYHDQPEIRRRNRKKVSSFGFGQPVQRS